MNLKPFKPPSFKRANDQESSTTLYKSTGDSKRRKLSPSEGDDDDDAGGNTFSGSHTSATSSKPVKPERAALQPLHNPPSPIKTNDEQVNRKHYFSIVWRKVTAKKNKVWEDDGVLAFKNGSITVYNSKGNSIGTTVQDKIPKVEDMLCLNGRDVQIEDEIDWDEFCRVIGKNGAAHNNEKVVIHHGISPNQAPSKPAPKLSLPEQMRQQVQKHNGKTQAAAATSSKSLPPPSRNAAFRQPLKESQVLQQAPSEVPIPRHDPTASNALVFRRLKKAPPGKQIVDVVLDPLLTKHLRHHQRDGVKFLYECVMGYRDFGGQGCILADDMGLGKTLQTIALIWTLVKQNPVYKDDPVVKKVLIVCPVTLVQNWKKEFRKWLGRDRLGVMSFGDEGSRLGMFDGRNFKVMIVGYERLQKIAEDLTKGAGIDLVICDEGHRLKTLKNKSAKAIETLNTARRIILSGTPIQNDLSEFFAMVNFVNDGVLGSPKAFIKDFEKPIIKSRQPNATEEDIERGRDASNELAQTTSAFILRRTADILSDYLPTKTEYVLFCRPSPEQANVYREVLKTPMFKSALGSHDAALQMITILKKLCNSPSLLKPKTDNNDPTKSTSLQTLNEMMPNGLSRFYHNSYASKIRLLDQLLHQIQKTTQDKVVLVSNYTATLDLMQNLLSSLNLGFRRLDGSVTAAKRQTMIDEFNRSSSTTCFAFLLSAKAGGLGVNLIGGNRLILFDVDWNPATDDQAMARIHREGQKKPCYIYRFLIKGGLEERIWQRQVVKRGLADSIMESDKATTNQKAKGKAAFSMDELRDLFRLDESDGLRTHDLIGCRCSGKGHPVASECSIKNDDDQIPDIDDLNSEDDQDDGVVRTFSFTKASAVSEEDLEQQERSILKGSSPRKSPPKTQRRRQEQDLQDLMTYTHVDTSDASKLEGHELEQLQNTISDPCLMNVLQRDRSILPGNIAYVFMKKSKLSGVDENETVDEDD